ncbi:hypothetical protein HY407_03940 [Candidatus Gottesmanbacteria bacterium]|nr:hypothetical protein [Candidatus Gottesmanbacteria bacterium]
MPPVLERVTSREIPKDRIKLWIIADFGWGDLAFSEVADELYSLVPGISAEKLSLPPFSTLSTGFAIRQLGLRRYYPGKLIFSNTAPRGMDEGIPWHGSAKQRLLFGILDSGVPVAAISSGYNWSFVKDRIGKDEDGVPLFFDIDISNEGSQFRSRDIYPGAIKRLIDRDETVLGERIDPASIPDYPRNQVMYVDGYKNIKISTPESEFDPALKVSPQLNVTLNGITRTAHNALSGLIPNEGLVLRTGSSGDIDDPFIELQLVGGHARKLFEPPDKEFVYVDNGNLVTFGPATDAGDLSESRAA